MPTTSRPISSDAVEVRRRAVRTARSKSSAASPRWTPSMSSSVRPSPQTHLDVVLPLVVAVGAVRDPQDGQFAQPRRQRRAEQQVDVEAQEGLGELGMADQGGQRGCPRPPGCAALRAASRTAPVDGVVPLVRGQRGHSHRRLLSDLRIRFSFRLIDFHVSRDGQCRARVSLFFHAKQIPGTWAEDVGFTCASAGGDGGNAARRLDRDRLTTLILAA